MLVSWRRSTRLQPLRTNTAVSSRSPRQCSVPSAARSTGGSTRPPVALPFLQSGLYKPTRPSRKNGAATARPPSSVGFVASVRTLPPPVARSRRLQRAHLSRPHFRRGQTSRPRSPEQIRNDITFAARRPTPRACHIVACGPALQLTQRRQRLRKRVSLSRGAAQLSASRGGSAGLRPTAPPGRAA